MIDPVEQTTYQREEAQTPGSLARNMLAQLIQIERREWRYFQQQQTAESRVKWLQARHCAEVARRILYGWEL